MAVFSVGVDLGSSFVKVAALDEHGEVVHEHYAPHHGKPLAAAAAALADLPCETFRLGVTGSAGDHLGELLGAPVLHPVQAKIRAVRDQVPGARNIIAVGAGSASLVELNAAGDFLNLSSNSLCAAGTGSFLDEQAKRLGISYDQMAGFAFVEDPPPVASRCAVFAKSDLIHLQQAGYSIPAMWTGLCKGCVDTFLQTLLKGKPLRGLTALVGGVAKNPQIGAWLKRYYGDQLRQAPHAHLAGAIGAAQLAEHEARRDDLPPMLLAADEGGDAKRISRGPALRLHKSVFPSFAVAEQHVDDAGNEVSLHERPAAGDLPVYLGIDIGSTSTKLVALGEDEKVWVDIYRKTGGNPIAAVQHLFAAMETIEARTGARFVVRGCGTTGSGRKFIGKVVGADAVINEISAHVAGAMQVDPRIDTIFEIGGQDAKYMRTQNGRIRDANMNFICAAGTGSFVEEQAGKLGFDVREIGEQVIDVRPPQTSDRCTVFMQEDVNNLLRQGYSSLDAIAAVLHSVVKNYLNKVVGNRHVSKERVFFQGATARNKGLVAAFENLLGVEIVVSPLCHQMGAYGVALLTGRQTAGDASTFRGFGLARQTIALRTEPCDLCNNHCKITFADIDGADSAPSWGYMCGKEPDDARRRTSDRFGLFRTRRRLLTAPLRTQAPAADAPTIALPQALAAHSHLPFWTRLLTELGCRVETSPDTDEAIKNRAEQVASGDFCFPMKAAIGHAVHLAENSAADWLLLPQMIASPPNGVNPNSYFCPYVQAYAGVSRAIMELNDLPTDRLLTPVLDLRWDRARLLREFATSLGGPLGKSKAKIKSALEAALAAQADFENACVTAGEKALAEIAARGEKAIVVLGRPYNTFDAGLNVALPEKIAEYGYRVVPIDFLPFEPETLGSEFQNIYWNYGQRILAAAKRIAKDDNLFAVFLSNFNCGPDSFLLTYAERIMGEKPMLVLELDSHGADAGYLTRVEAFLDVVAQHDTAPAGAGIAIPPVTTADMKRRTLWLPPMHPLVGPLTARTFRRFGYNARPLPPEDREAYELGRQVVRGSECLPAHVTIGGLLKQLRAIDADPSEHAFFMATAEGPCRFGQYALLHRLILDEYGYQDVPILSPSSFNSYQGLEEKIRRPLWEAFMAADVLYKMLCRTRPYEQNAGAANALLAELMELFGDAMEKGEALEPLVKKAARAFADLPRHDVRKPLVGIVGEIYVRCNEFSNGYLVDDIEKFGGEAWLTPLSEWFLYTAYIQGWSAKQDMAGLAARGRSLIKNKFLGATEQRFYRWASPLLDDRHEPPIDQVLDEGKRFLPLNFAGESILTVGRAVKFIDQGAALVVNAAPFGCMPGTLTAAILEQVQQERQTPIVAQYYDGEGDINRRLGIVIHEMAAKMEAERRARTSAG
jgi:predicted CoA-substrate-specific enzyme activase